jgi:DNA-binding response OmpR family regulator
MHKILIVEDNISLTSTLHQVLTQPFRKTQSVRTISEAYQKITQHKYDLVMLDRNLPDGDGLEIVQHMSKTKLETPILMLTEKNATSERVMGLRQGADDYLGKPFSVDELTLRVDNLLNKTKRMDDRNSPDERLHLFPASGVVQLGTRKFTFRRREYEIFAFLAHHKNAVVSRDMLINNLWVNEEVPTYSTIDVYIRRIRIILGGKSRIIQTIRSYGYRLKI